MERERDELRAYIEEDNRAIKERVSKEAEEAAARLEEETR